MGKLRPLLQQRVVRILLENGFERVRSGKHITFKKRVDDEALTSWVPRHKEVSVFVIHYIIRQTRKPRSEFER